MYMPMLSFVVLWLLMYSRYINHFPLSPYYHSTFRLISTHFLIVFLLAYFIKSCHCPMYPIEYIICYSEYLVFLYHTFRISSITLSWKYTSILLVSYCYYHLFVDFFDYVDSTGVTSEFYSHCDGFSFWLNL